MVVNNHIILAARCEHFLNCQQSEFCFILLFVLKFYEVCILWGAAVTQWLKCCATNPKVAGSIPAGVSGFFINIKSFRSHYGPWVDSASRGKGGRCVRLTTYQHPVPLSRNLGTLTSWNPLDLSRPVMGLLYRYLFNILFPIWYSDALKNIPTKYTIPDSLVFGKCPSRNVCVMYESLKEWCWK